MKNNEELEITHKNKGDIDKYGNVIEWETDGYTDNFQVNYKEANELESKEQENKNNDNKQ